MNPAMKFRAKKHGHEIELYGDIGIDISAKEFAAELKALGDAKNIVLRINSFGGDVFDGLAIYSRLASSGANITVYIDGMAGSIASVIAMAGKEIHIAEPYDPFAYKELHHLEGLQLAPKGKAPQMLADGVFDRDGDLPVTPSGGLLGVGNPIAAAGTMKICELFWQMRGEAGARQVPGRPERGVAQAWGDLMQVGTVVVMGVN